MKQSYLFFAVALFLLSSSCSPKIQFLRSTAVPAAEGKINIKKDKNDNYKLSIHVIHLAKPQDLPIPAQVYVVWMETPGNDVKNLGQLKSGSNLLNRALTASLETVTTFEPDRIFITAEADPATTYPTGQEILTTGGI